MKKPKKILLRMYKFKNQKKWNKDTSLPLYEGQTIKNVINNMYSGTNFRITSYRTKKISPNKTKVYAIITKN